MILVLWLVALGVVVVALVQVPWGEASSDRGYAVGIEPDGRIRWQDGSVTKAEVDRVLRADWRRWGEPPDALR